MLILAELVCMSFRLLKCLFSKGASLKRLFLCFCLFSSFLNEGECADLSADQAKPTFSLTNPLFDPVAVVDLETKRFNESPNLVLREDFSRAMVALKNDKYADVSRALDELAFSASVRGYSNLPDFSKILLDRASRFSGKDSYEKVRFLVTQSAMLSPGDARILMSASTFYKDIGMTKSLQYFYSALRVLPKQPVFFATIALNTSLVFLMALTISFFFASIIQMLSLSARIHRGLVSLSPWNFRGILPPICLFALFVIPLYGGILFAMGVWSIVLACSKSSKKTFGARKMFGISIAALCLLWGFGMPAITTVGYNLKLDSTGVFEDINRFGFSPRGEKYVLSALEEKPSDLMHLFSHGIISKLKGLPKLAEERFETVMSLSSPGTYIYNASQANLGVLDYEDGNYKRAFKVFKNVEARGQSDFELYYNMANVSTLVFREDLHSLYFNKAKAVDSTRLETLVGEANLTPKALLYPAPNYLLYSLLFKPVSETNKSHAVSIQEGQQKIFSYLVFGADSKGIILFGLIVALGVLLLPKFARQRSRDFKKSNAEKVNWSLFPGTAPLAGDRPVLGALVLSVSLAFLLAGVGTPLNFYGNFNSANSLAKEALIFSILVFLLTAFLFGFFRKFSRSANHE